MQQNSFVSSFLIVPENREEYSYEEVDAPEKKLLTWTSLSTHFNDRFEQMNERSTKMDDKPKQALAGQRYYSKKQGNRMGKWKGDRDAERQKDDSAFDNDREASSDDCKFLKKTSHRRDKGRNETWWSGKTEQLSDHVTEVDRRRNRNHSEHARGYSADAQESVEWMQQKHDEKIRRLEQHYEFRTKEMIHGLSQVMKEVQCDESLKVLNRNPDTARLTTDRLEEIIVSTLNRLIDAKSKRGRKQQERIARLEAKTKSFRDKLLNAQKVVTNVEQAAATTAEKANREVSMALQTRKEAEASIDLLGRFITQLKAKLIQISSTCVDRAEGPEQGPSTLNEDVCFNLETLGNPDATAEHQLVTHLAEKQRQCSRILTLLTEYEKHMRKLSFITTENNEMKDEKAKLKVTIKGLKQKNEGLSTKLTSLATKTEELQMIRKQHQTDKDSSRTCLIEAKNDLTNSFLLLKHAEEEKRTLKAENDDLQRLTRDLKSEVVMKTEEFTQRKSNLVQRLKQMKQEHSKLRREIQKKETEVEVFKNKIYKGEEQLRWKVCTMTKEKEDLIRSHKENLAATTKTMKLKYEKLMLKKMLDTAVSATDASEQNVNLRALFEGDDKVIGNRELNESSLCLDQSEKEIDLVQTVLQRAQKIEAELSKKVEEATADNRQLVGEIAQCEAVIDELRKRLKDALEKAEQYTSMEAIWNEKKSSLASEVQHLSTGVTSKHAENDNLRRQLDIQLQQMKQSNARIKELSRKQKEQEDALQTKQMETTALETTLGKRDDVASQLEVQLLECRGKLAGLENSREHLRQQHENSVDETQQLRMKLRKLSRGMAGVLNRMSRIQKERVGQISKDLGALRSYVIEFPKRCFNQLSLMCRQKTLCCVRYFQNQFMTAEVSLGKLENENVDLRHCLELEVEKVKTMQVRLQQKATLAHEKKEEALHNGQKVEALQHRMVLLLQTFQSIGFDVSPELSHVDERIMDDLIQKVEEHYANGAKSSAKHKRLLFDAEKRIRSLETKLTQKLPETELKSMELESELKDCRETNESLNERNRGLTIRNRLLEKHQTTMQQEVESLSSTVSHLNKIILQANIKKGRGAHVSEPILAEVPEHCTTSPSIDDRIDFHLSLTDSESSRVRPSKQSLLVKPSQPCDTAASGDSDNMMRTRLVDREEGHIVDSMQGPLKLDDLAETCKEIEQSSKTAEEESISQLKQIIERAKSVRERSLSASLTGRKHDGMAGRPSTISIETNQENSREGDRITATLVYDPKSPKPVQLSMCNLDLSLRK